MPSRAQPASMRAAASLPRQAVQVGLEQQVAPDAQIQVERHLLEHHADVAQRRGRGAAAANDPATSTSPSSAANSPVSTWNSVDLPAPLGPSKATN